MQRWTSEPLALAAAPEPTFTRVDLAFEEVDHSGDSFSVRVFLNNPEADESTRTELDEGYAGHFTVFAHGECWGEQDHCEVKEPLGTFDLREEHPLTPYTITHTITDAFRARVPGGEPFTVTALAFRLGEQGEEVEILRFSYLALLVYE
jgi:hypothetical protein